MTRGAMTGLAVALPMLAIAQFNVNYLVSDSQAAQPASITDAGLLNAWGLSYGPTSPFWVSSNGAGTSTLYRVDPLTQSTTKLGLTVSIPGAGNVTGQVFNSNASAFNGNAFLFVSEDGTVSGWRGALGTTAETLSTGSPDNVYKGAAIATTGGHSYLYAANFRSGAIDVYKGDAAAPGLGAFVDPNLPSVFAPFNIQALNGALYVAYAKQGAGLDEAAGAGLGYVDSFDLQGTFLARVAGQGTLNAPWGLAIAPSSFGAMAGALLVGNFGDGQISAFDPTTHAFLGSLLGAGGLPITIDGLWGISPGNGGNAGSAGLLYFTAGPDDENHGVLGVLTVVAVPEPATGLMTIAGLLMIFFGTRRRLQ
jgi:uncharacterized protein (TIGR03118 family)